MGNGVTARRWYQNVPVEGVRFEDLGRKESGFWGKGKWENFIKPLLPNDGRTFVEIGCNAGLFLKMATEAGFKNVIGVEGHPQIIDQAEYFKKQNGGTYKLVQQCVGKDFVPDQLPLADVILFANVHYYFPVSVFSQLVDSLKSRTMHCIVVSAKARRLSGNAFCDLNSVRGYFHDWQEIGMVRGIDEEGDPAPRKQMYGVSFRGNLDTIDVENTCNLWRRGSVLSNKHKQSALPAALEEYFKKVLDGETFDIEETLLYEYWIHYASPKWIRKRLAYNKFLLEDIRANGMKEPVYLDRSGKFLDGLHRLVIAKELGHKHILVRRL